MSVLLQICFVIVTISVVAIAVATIRVMSHFRKASDEFSRLAEEAQQWIDQLKYVTREAEGVIGSVREIVPRLQRIVGRFETIGERMAGLTDQAVQEVEVPVRKAVAMARGVRLGTAHFLERLNQRLTGRPATNGGLHHE